jgi:opacity protein-like surface antigen
MRAPLGLVGFFSVLVVATATHAFAGQRWEIEAHGGVLMSTNPTNGTVALPPAGPDIPLNAALPNSITRRVPSWYFGDGAAILNQIVGVRSPVKIAPLDPMLESRIVERQSATSFGVRVDRSLTPRFDVEFAFDEAQGELTLRSSSKDVANASQASFPAMWNLLLSALSSGSQVVTSDAMIDDKRGRQLVTSGTLLINLLSSTSFTPYVAVGAGYITAHNGAPSVTLVGNYSFTFAPIPITPIPPFHINETDTVKIQAAARNSMTWVFGGGVKYALGDHWGVRADLRDHVNRDVVRTTVTTNPASVASGSSGTLTFALSQNAPLLIFSSSPLALSTLSTALPEFRTFSGSGFVNQVNTSAGVFWRF